MIGCSPDANQDVKFWNTIVVACVVFAFNSPAQEPVTLMRFAVTGAGNRTQDARILSATPKPLGHQRLVEQQVMFSLERNLMN